MSLQRSPLEACDDARLFGVDLWPRQRELLAAAQAHRVNIWALGRRSGKTTMAGVLCLWDCLLRPECDVMVRRGETRYAVCVATALRQSRITFAAARSIVQSSPALSRLLVGSTANELHFRLPSGARTCLRAIPCASRSAPGLPISCLVLDEAAKMITETDGPAAAQEIWRALVPSTAQFGEHGRILVCSSPYGTDGLFADLFHRGLAGDLPGADVRNHPTADCNPTITQEFLDNERQIDPLSFSSEYEAKFEQGGDSLLDVASLTLAPPAAPELGTDWVCGLDPAFAVRGDGFGVALVGRAVGDRDHLICGEVGALSPEGDFTGALEQVIALAQSYGARVVTDQFAAAAVLDVLRRAGLRAEQRTMTAQSKTAIFTELRARCDAGTITIADHADLLGQLRRIQVRLRVGSASVTSPRTGGAHGDIAQALALAVHEHRARKTSGWRPMLDVAA